MKCKLDDRIVSQLSYWTGSIFSWQWFTPLLLSSIPFSSSIQFCILLLNKWLHDLLNRYKVIETKPKTKLLSYEAINSNPFLAYKFLAASWCSVVISSMALYLNERQWSNAISIIAEAIPLLWCFLLTAILFSNATDSGGSFISGSENWQIDEKNVSTRTIFSNDLSQSISF